MFEEDKEIRIPSHLLALVKDGPKYCPYCVDAFGTEIVWLDDETVLLACGSRLSLAIKTIRRTKNCRIGELEDELSATEADRDYYSGIVDSLHLEPLHKKGDSCPTWYDGTCRCTVITIRNLLKALSDAHLEIRKLSGSKT